MFKRALKPQEIAAIANVGTHGKCRVVCQVPSVTTLCPESRTATIFIKVCNFTGSAKQIAWSLQTFSPTLTFSPSGGVATVPARYSGLVTFPGCTDIPIQIIEPPSALSGQYEPYTLRIEENGVTICTSQGFALITNGPNCPSRVDTLGGAGITAFGVSNGSGTTSSLSYRIQAIPSDGDPTDQVLMLDQGAPGQSVVGNVSVPPMSASQISVDASFADHDPFRLYTIELSTYDATASAYLPLASASVRSNLTPTSYFLDCNMNGVPDSADIQSGHSADLDHDGIPDECESQATGVEPVEGMSLQLGVFPNPIVGRPRVRFTLVDESPATLELFDLEGRSCLSRAVGFLGRGPHALDLQLQRPGIYFLRLTQQGVSRWTRIVALH